MSTPRVKICILVNELLPGGAQRIVLDIAKNVDRERFDLVVVQLKSHTHFGAVPNLVQDFDAIGARVVSIEGGRRIGLRELYRLYRLLRREQPSIVHTFLPYAGIVGRVISRLAGIRTVISTQCNLPVAYTRFVYWLDRWTLYLASTWVGATEGIEMAYSGSFESFSLKSWQTGRRHFTIVAGVDIPSFDARLQRADRNALRQALGISDSEILILMIARLVSWKGHKDLLASLVHLPPSVHISLVGWGPLEKELRSQAESLGCSERVHFLLARPDVPELLAASDIYAQTHGHAPDGSIWQGPNTSQMEACAARVPSVSTRVPLIERLIEDGVTGKLAEPDNPRSIAEALSYLMQHPDDARIFAAAARARVEERYSIENMVRLYENLYEVAR